MFPSLDREKLRGSARDLLCELPECETGWWGQGQPFSRFMYKTLPLQPESPEVIEGTSQQSLSLPPASEVGVLGMP